MAGKTITARANRSFSTIRQGDVVTIGEDDARLQVYLNSGYLTEVEGDEAKGAKKVDSLDDNEPEVVWDGKPGNRRGATVDEADAETDTDDAKATVTKAADNTKTLKSSPAPVKESNGTR